MACFKDVRFYLFLNSYSGKTIASYLREKYKRIKLEKAIKRLSIVLNFNCEKLEAFIIQRIELKCPYIKTPSRIKVYLDIESELMKLTEEKVNEDSTAKEDYHNQLLYPAIERATGNSLSNIRSDETFQEKLQDKTKEYTSVYYKVAYKYKLPTIRIVPFIIRLIT